MMTGLEGSVSMTVADIGASIKIDTVVDPREILKHLPKTP